MSVGDVVVVGGGPAGLASAIATARRGMSVTVVDPRSAPIDKACGEGLMPSTREALQRLGVEVAGQPLHGVRYASADGARSVSGLFRTGSGLGVRRTALSEALAARAAELGVRRCTGRVVELTERAESVLVTVSTPQGRASEQARYAVVCDGLHSPTRHRLGWGAASPTGRPRYGLRRHYRLPAPDAGDLVSVLWAAECEAYITPLAPDLINVAVLCGGGQAYDSWLQQFPALTDLLASAEPVSDVRGAGPLRQRVLRPASDRMVLAGDAAGYVDALTGEGIGIALSSAELVADCLTAGSLRRYPARLSRLTARPRALTEALLRASSARVLRPQLVTVSQCFPRTYSWFVNALA